MRNNISGVLKLNSSEFALKLLKRRGWLYGAEEGIGSSLRVSYRKRRKNVRPKQHRKILDVRML
jgi:hypothetical protein